MKRYRQSKCRLRGNYLGGFLLLLACWPTLTVQADPLRTNAAVANYGANTSVNRNEVYALLDNAALYLRQNAFDLALVELEKAYELTRSEQDSPLFIDVQNALASAYYDAGQVPVARRYLEEALRIAPQDSLARSITLFNLGHINATQGLSEKARLQFSESLTLSRELGDLSGEAFALKALGVNALAARDSRQARQFLEQALTAFVRQNDVIQEANVYRHLGDIALADEKFDEAIRLYLQALPVFMANGIDVGLMRVYRGLGGAHEALGHFEKALLANKAYAAMQQDILQLQGREGVQRLQVEFDTRRYADANDQLLSMNHSQQLELDYQQSLLHKQYLIIVLASGVLVLILTLFVRSQQFARQMQALATTDELTGLRNRRAILQKGISEWQRARRFERPFSCLMFDIDRFKLINDTFGHGTGDKVLQEVASVISASLRQSDSLGRLGGEEFLLIAPETDPEKAHSLAERIRQRVAKLVFPEMPGKSVTVSIGVAQMVGEHSLEELIRHADGALYSAKHEGRNQVVMCQA